MRATNNLTILFLPNGSVGTVSIGATATAVCEPIYLLVGKRQRMLNTSGGSTESTWTNYQDLGNLWVVINPQTGMITTEPVGTTSGGIAGDAASARGLAGQMIGIGGK